MFKEAWADRRCIVPADGFYEWKGGMPAQPYFITMPTHKVFWFAGLWQPGEVLILTGPATGFLRSIHDRQPIVLPERELDWWFSEPDTYRGHEGGGVIRRSTSIAAFEAYPVTPQMSNPRFEYPECVQAINAAQPDLIAHYDEYCYLPLYVLAGDYPLWARLRTSDKDGADGVVAALAQIVPAVRKRCRRARIIVRGDSGFCREEIMAWCERQAEVYLCGLCQKQRLGGTLGANAGGGTNALVPVRRKPSAGVRAV